MRRTLFLSIITYALLLAGLATLRGDLLALCLPFVLYLALGYLRAPEELHLEMDRRIDVERAVPNTPVIITLTITNHGSHLEELFLDDTLPSDLTLHSGSTCSLVTLAKGDSHTWTYTVSGPRGGYVFETLKAHTTDHLAVAGREVRLDAKGQLFIYPPVTRLRQVVIRPRKTRVYAGNIPARAGGSGIEFYGVRAYSVGDPPRSINWRASARHVDELYANEFQQERVADVAIVLDGRWRTNEFSRGHSLFEYSVQAAASLADAFLAQGNRVGMLVYSMYLNWVLPAYGKVQREKILQALARARPGGSDVFAGLQHIPTRLFPPHSQIVLVSPLNEDDLTPLIQLRAHGYQVLTVAPNPVTFELSFLPKQKEVDLAARVVRMERALLLRKLQRAGVQVLDWDITHPFDQVVQRELSRIPAWLQMQGSLK
ncbi:MAG: DUF58 domain-containing protein [Anaerolineales bacterium]|nr:DUF58 domain-containing protein [Anaerolineales bacterium]